MVGVYTQPTNWSSWSARGVEAKDAVLFPNGYPTEDQGSADIKIAHASEYRPNAAGEVLPETLSPTTGADANRRVAIFVHGYNTNAGEADKATTEVYKRLYWTGFRGSLIGFGWNGDQYKIPVADVSLFDENVYNAFQAAPRLMQLLDKVSGGANSWTAGNPERVDIMAHSLGNLVMWESLRLAERLGKGARIHNMVGIEAAIWREAFEREQPLVYDKPMEKRQEGQYVAAAKGVPFDDTKTYSVEEQKKSSWRFWFRQSTQGDGGTGPAHERDLLATLATGGRYINSYNPDDHALRGAMQFNDAVSRMFQHCNRDRFHTAVRTLSDNFSINSMEKMPALMAVRSLLYGPANLLDPARSGYPALNLPAGAVPVMLGDPRVVNINAQSYGWYERAHGHFAYGDRKDTTRPLLDNKMDFSLPSIWNWYQEVFNTSHGITLGNA